MWRDQRGACLGLWACALLLQLAAGTAPACEIPVFRYAMERWQADPYEVIVFHRGDLDASNDAILARVRSQTPEGRGPCNLEIFDVDLDAAEVRPDMKASWDEQQNPPLPWVVVNRPFRRGKPSVSVWRGPLADLPLQPLLSSPARGELEHRLLRGDSVIWLVLKSQDPKRDAECVDQLKQSLDALQNEIQIPAGVGQPGSEIYANLPLRVRFTILEVDPEDPAETLLMAMLLGQEGAARRGEQPVAIPVFGRARALEVFPQEKLEPQLIEDVTRYLSEGCSCQVKALNPGYDLLMGVGWDELLFGADAAPIPVPAAADPPAGPVYVPIPPGRASQER